MDRAADAAAGGKHPVRGIDDGVHVERGDVAFDDLDAVRHRRIGRPVGVEIKLERRIRP